jgi:nucleoid DNA-binding protein
MNKTQLISEIANLTWLNQKDVEQMVNAAIAVLKEDPSLRIRGLFTISVRSRKGKTVKCPNGKTYTYPTRDVPVMKPSKEWINNLN